MTLYRARILWAGPGHLLENAAVAVHEGEIVAVGPFNELRESVRAPDTNGAPSIVDLGDCILFPGFINAHCHLDYTLCRGLIAPQNTFAAWIERINAYKRSFSDEDWRQSVSIGLNESLRCGTTTILNIAAYTHLLPLLEEIPPRVWWFSELIDLVRREDPREHARRLESLLTERAAWRGGRGLAPHAPYTASRALYLACDGMATDAHTLPVSTHAAETAEETELFRNAHGPLHDLLARLGRSMTDCGAGSPFFHLLLEGRLRAPWIVAHANEPEPGVPEAMALHKWSVVHCPGTHRYFNRPPFPAQRYLDAGVNLCVGTDSLASNDSLSLLGELQRFHRSHPGLPPGFLLATITRNGAQALRMEGRLGILAPGALADAVAIPFSGAQQEAEEHALSWCGPLEWVMVGGKPAL